MSPAIARLYANQIKPELGGELSNTLLLRIYGDQRQAILAKRIVKLHQHF